MVGESRSSGPPRGNLQRVLVNFWRYWVITVFGRPQSRRQAAFRGDGDYAAGYVEIGDNGKQRFRGHGVLGALFVPSGGNRQ